MSEFVLAIIFVDGQLVLERQANSGPSPATAFIQGEVGAGETAAEAVSRVIREKLGLSGQPVFPLPSDAVNHTTAFLVDVPGLKPEALAEDADLKFYPLRDWKDLTHYDKRCLVKLVETCYQQDYQPPWLSRLEEQILADKSLPNTYSSLQARKQQCRHSRLDATLSPAHVGTFLLLSLLTGIIFDIFFTEFRFGLSVPVFALLVTGFFFYSCKDNLIRSSFTAVFLLLASLALAANFAVHANEFLMFLNTLALPLLLTGSYILLRYPDTPWQVVALAVSLISRLTLKTGENFLKPFTILKRLVKPPDNNKLNPTYTHILIGIGLSLPLLLIIIPLLASADSVFNYYLSDLAGIFKGLRLGSLVADLIIIVLVTCYTFGYFRSFKYEEPETINFDIPRALPPVTVMTVLTVINLVYLLFTIVQASYLYGGTGAALPANFTYAEYARRGFFELVLVTIINFTLLTIARNLTAAATFTGKTILNGLYTLLIAFTLNMLYSANFRMALYEQAFGHTHMRSYVQYFLLLLLLLFIITLAGIWSSRVNITKLSLLAAVVMLLVLNFANVDVSIARRNIARYEQTGKIDAYYLTALSHDAIPELVVFLENSSLDAETVGILRENLTYRHERLNRKRPWYEFNLARYNAARATREYFGR